MEILRFTDCFLFIKICWNCFDVVWLSFCSAPIILPHLIAESSIALAKYFRFSKLHAVGFKTNYISYIWCFVHSNQYLLLFHLWFELDFVTSLNSHLHETCFANVFDLFISVIRLNKLRFKSSALFGIHTLLD